MSQNTNPPKLTTYVLRKDGTVVEYAHIMLCRDKSNPFIDLIRPVPITNPDTLVNKDNVTIRVYYEYNKAFGAVTYKVVERSFK
jgi:hypothetical protein